MSSLSIGIVGLPNSGKSTLFKALTKRQDVAIANYPFTTIEPNIGIVPVPDERLQKLWAVTKSAKMMPATVTFVDIAGLVKGAHRGEGLGNQFLAHIREVDALVHVVRAFSDSNVPGSADPQSDIGAVNAELALADLATVKKRLDDTKLKARATNDAKSLELAALYERIAEGSEGGVMVRDFNLTDEEQNTIRDLFLLTAKPCLILFNTDKDIPKQSEDVTTLALNAKFEADLTELPEKEAGEFMQAEGLAEQGLDALIRKGYELLDLITFFTYNEKETRAWPVKRGTKAPQAAGAIHTDFERGFIRAEVGNWKDFVELGGEAVMREKGMWRIEGKDYAIQDGDVCYFRFAV